jgi:hypothetical protein
VHVGVDGHVTSIRIPEMQVSSARKCVREARKRGEKVRNMRGTVAALPRWHICSYCWQAGLSLTPIVHCCMVLNHRRRKEIFSRLVVQS